MDEILNLTAFFELKEFRKNVTVYVQYMVFLNQNHFEQKLSTFYKSYASQ